MSGDYRGGNNTRKIVDIYDVKKAREKKGLFYEINVEKN